MNKILDGFILVDKPHGWTSFDVVAKIRGIVTTEIKKTPELSACEQCAEASKRAIEAMDETKDSPEDQEARVLAIKREIYSSPQGHRHKVRVGHAGTLDPMATGLLIVAIGKATKKIDKVVKQGKVYEAELTLGATSTTDDAEGELTQMSDAIPEHDDLERIVESFVGEMEQIPPIFSAIKIDGQRAYKAARAGKTPEMKPRTVRIRSISDARYEYPKLSFITDVSSGTYIRSLARDIGEKLETGAYLTALRRLSIGDYSVQAALSMDDLSIESIHDSLKTIA